MSHRKRIQMKIGVMVLLLVMLFFFFVVSYQKHSDTKPSGEMVRRDEVTILVQKMAECTGVDEEELWEKVPLNTERENWYDMFDQLITYYQIDHDIQKKQLGDLQIYLCGQQLLTIRNDPEKEIILKNIYLEESSEEGITFFYQGTTVHVATPSKTHSSGVADISFCHGEVKEIMKKNELVSGKLLQITPEEIVLEGKGSYRISEECQGYRVHETLTNVTLKELAIGYDFTDFVLEDGKVCGFLVAMNEEMEMVRIAIHNSDYENLYHEEIEFYSEQELCLTYYDGDNETQESVAPMHTICISIDSDRARHDRIKIETTTNTGRICFPGIVRNQGIPSYRGSMEIFCTEKGFVLINEVLLEEYLYAVVPSEMPSSYPIEALKAQAVCARTYAYRYLQVAGLPELGAHMDDSVNFQVYNNIMERASSTNAVRETTGELLLYQELPVFSYYYSTSCGFGTDDGIWNTDNESSLPYLNSIHISPEKNTEHDMSKEEYFREYLSTVKDTDYEYEEPWYRWNYEVNQLDAEKLYQRLRKRQIDTPEFHKVYALTSTRRNPGGILTQIEIKTDQGKIRIDGEYNIRYVLNAGGCVIRQDGSEYELTTILPSAYFFVVPMEQDDHLTGYQLIGGGFGHGVGMSQNGAGRMADEGKNYRDILTMFYKDCELAKIY